MSDVLDYVSALVSRYRYGFASYKADDADKDFADRAALLLSERLIDAVLNDPELHADVVGADTIRAWGRKRAEAEAAREREEEEKKARAREYNRRRKAEQEARGT